VKEKGWELIQLAEEIVQPTSTSHVDHSTLKFRIRTHQITIENMINQLKE
jgi:hypothetical protein